MEKIKNAAKELQQTTKSVRSWERHPHREKQMGGNQGPQWVKEANLLVRASDRNPALGLYGESQIGKSFLISALATNEEQIFILDPTLDPTSDKHICFLKLLNPSGMGESTGIITRFTTKEGNRFGQNRKSFLGELLNYEDLVMAMVHGVHSDVEQAEPPENFKADAQSIIKKLKDAKKNAQSNSESDKDIQPVESVLLALEQVRQLKYFPGYIRILDECKFETVLCEYSDAEKVPSADLLAESIALIWGGHNSESLKQLYTIIHKVLVSLNGSDILEIPIKDVIAEEGRQKSLLDVKLLEDLFNLSPTVTVYGRGTDEGEQDDPISFEIARASLAAVLSEIVLPVKESANQEPPSLISIGDIIDFPGSRAAGRGTRRQDVKQLEAVSIFLRGKLIQIYRKLVVQNEIGVLCIGVGVTGNPEAGVQNQRAIELWLEQEKMSEVENPSLLAVVTKCDQLLTKKEAVGAGAANDFKKVIDKLQKYSAAHYDWLFDWPGYSLETTSQIAGKKKPFKSVIFVFNPRYVKDNATVLMQDQELQKFLIDATQGPDVVRHCKKPDPWVTGLGKKVPNSDDYTGNIHTLKDESCNQLKKVDRKAILRRRIKKLLAELKQKFGGMHRREGAVDENGRKESQRKLRALQRALEEATIARDPLRPRGKRSGLASILESVEITPVMIEQGISKLKTSVDENHQYMSENGVYKFVHEQWQMRTQRITDDSSMAIKNMFGESGSKLRELLLEIPKKYPKFKENCLAVIDKRFDFLETNRLEMLSEPLAECWNANILDWGFPIAESLLQGGIAPVGDTKLRSGLWILRHWRVHIEHLIQSMEDPEGPPPPDYEEVQMILAGIDKTEKAMEDIH